MWAFFSTLDEKRIVTHAVSDFENIADSDLLELQSALYELRHADGSEVSLGTYIQDRERIA